MQTSSFRRKNTAEFEQKTVLPLLLHEHPLLTVPVESCRKRSKPLQLKGFDRSVNFFASLLTRRDDFGRVVNQGFSAPIRILGVECTPLFRVRVADNSVAHSLLSVGFLTYFPLFILASAGFGSSSGMPHTVPIRMAPGTRPSAHKICMRRVEMPHRSAVCVIDKYFMATPISLVGA